MRYRGGIPLLVSAALLAGGHAAANPTGPTVVHGNATFTTAGHGLTVTNTPGSVITWQDFSVASQEITRFLQTSSSSAVLNRVTGGSPSAILGQIQSNGRVFVVNPNGVLFGPSSQVGAASFTATTGQIADSAFIAGAGTPVGGATMTIGGPLNINMMGSASLSGTTATIEALSLSGNLSMVAGTININGGLSGSNISLATTGGPIAGGNVTIATLGTISASGVQVTTAGTTQSGGSVTIVTNATPGTIVTIATPGAISASNGVQLTAGGATQSVGSVTIAGGGSGVAGSPSSVPAAVPAAGAVESRSASRSTPIALEAPSPVAQAIFLLEKREPRF